MSQKTWLFAGALAVAALIVGLVISLRGDDAPASTRRDGEPRVTVPAAGPAPAAGGVSPSAAPPPTAVAPEPARPTPLPPVEADGDDGRPEVRDHRGEGATGTLSLIAAGTVASVRRALNQQIKGCAQGVTVAKRPIRVTAHAVLHAAGGRLTAREVEVTSADPLPPEITDCVRKAYEGLSTDAQGSQPDGEDRVHMPWTLP